LNGAPSQLFEAFLFGSTSLDNQVEILMGNAYNELVDGRDLTFLYTNIFGDMATGVVVYDVDIPDVTNLADFDNDGDIDGNDFLRWQTSYNQDAAGDADRDGDTDRNDLLIWQQQFGSVGQNTSIAIPEPATFIICGLLFFGSVITKFLCRHLQPSPTTAAVTLPIVLALIVIVSVPAMGDTFNDREYQMGDETGEGAVAGGYVSSTWDSADQPGSGDLQDLFQGGNARYVNTSARPFADGGTELGIQFNGISDFLEGDRLDYPETSTASAAANPPGPVDYYGISKRGFQCWINPASPGNGVAQDIVMDTNNHGVRLSETGNWMMRYINLDYDSGIPAVAGQWYHIELVVPDGESLSAQMYVNGIAVAAAFGDYRNRNQSESLVIGANTGFLSGTENFFAGIVDDLDMFVMGVSAKDFNDYGEFNPGTDNEFIAKTMESIDVADVNANGTVDYDDVDAFVAGWFSKNLINGIPVGDLGSRHNGDLNYDGIVDLADWSILNAANPGIGSAAMACIQGVPEPATIALVSLLLFGSLSCRGLRLL
ncbi:MAG: hypothetical protein JW829_05335, partial [Pirellulales bacterium]|nr:hypothetical protein [Pirellulales bacterium]